MAATLAMVLVKRTAYSKETNSGVLYNYIIKASADGSTATLYKSPAIPSTTYTAGNTAASNLETAIANFDESPIPTNTRIVKDKMALCVIWLNTYATLVEPIANAELNRTTREEAATNINIAGLSFRQLVTGKKGIPDEPEFEVNNVGTGVLKAEITNGVDYKPTSTNFIAVQLPPVTEPPTPDPTVELINGQLKVTMHSAGEIVTQQATGKGKFTTINVSNPGKPYAVYAYSQNGKKQVSDLTEPEYVTG